MNKNKASKNLEIKNSAAYRNMRQVMDARVRLAVEVNEVRKKGGLTQQELARRAGTTQKMISKIETADTNVGFDLLQRIVASLDLRMQIGEKVFVDARPVSSGKFYLFPDGFLLDGAVNDKTASQVISIKQTTIKNNEK